MTNKEFAYRMNHATREEIARAMEALPTDALEWVEKFEALSHRGTITPAPASAEGDDLAESETNSQKKGGC